MSKADCTLSQDELKSQLNYCADTGVFTWNVTKNRVSKGDIAGFKTAKGYLSTKIFGKAYRLHRLAWFYVYGKWPNDQIDHVNGIRTDNRISNLRNATPAENAQNRCLATLPNRSSKKLGVSVNKVSGKYQARMVVNGKYFYFGTFDNEEEASSAYNAKKTELTQFFNPERI